MREVSSSFKDAASRQETSAIPLVLLTITHTDLGTDNPLRLVNDSADITSRGHVYTSFPFEVEIPDDSEGKTPTARITCVNADLRILRAIRSLTSTPTVKLEIILAAFPDVVEATFPELEITAAPWDNFNITCELSMDALLGEPYPCLRFTPSNAPGVF